MKEIPVFDENFGLVPVDDCGYVQSARAADEEFKQLQVSSFIY